MYNSIFKSFSNKAFFNIVVISIYYLIVVLPHEEVGILVSKLFRPLGRDNYNLTIAIISIIGLNFYLFKIYQNRNIQHNKLLVFYLVSNIIFAIISFKVLFVVNVEAIHFLQYLVFALLCFPLFKNYNLTLLYSTLAGAIDEGYQYYFLAPEKNKYFDFNDVIIDMVGCFFGLILIRSYKKKIKPYSIISFLKSKHFFFILILVFALIVMYVSGIFVVNYDPSNARAMFWLVTEKANGFWSSLPPKVLFHIVRPLEGMIIVSFMFIFYSQIYRGSEKVYFQN